MRIIVVIAAIVAASFAAAAPAGPSLRGEVSVQGRYVEVIHHRPGVRAELLSLWNDRVSPLPIGNAQVVCDIIKQTLQLCRTVISLPRGRIVGQGSRSGANRYFLAVTGGTGDYIGVSGVIRVSRTPAVLLIDIDLV